MRRIKGVDTGKPGCGFSGVPISVETCPHYLNFVSERVAEGDTSLKCAPPLRGAANQAALWEGLLDGSIDSLASDHSPSPAGMKLLGSGDFSRAWGGIAGALDTLWGSQPGILHLRKEQRNSQEKRTPVLWGQLCKKPKEVLAVVRLAVRKQTTKMRQGKLRTLVEWSLPDCQRAVNTNFRPVLCGKFADGVFLSVGV